ncbi:hypothetical protein [Actinoplanes sp. NPDC026619]|uniref:hypothetical protein n=1 Tax=Actinoplanes sp. NPDC026619 TaxID=3155798 RepID=UPI00340B56BD
MFGFPRDATFDRAWDERARAYLLAAGCDPDAPYRRDWMRREVVRRREMRQRVRAAE